MTLNMHSWWSMHGKLPLYLWNPVRSDLTFKSEYQRPLKGSFVPTVSDRFCTFQNGFNASDGYRISQIGMQQPQRVAPTYYLANYPKTAWKWRNFGWGRTHPFAPPRSVNECSLNALQNRPDWLLFCMFFHKICIKFSLRCMPVLKNILQIPNNDQSYHRTDINTFYFSILSFILLSTILWTSSSLFNTFTSISK